MILATLANQGGDLPSTGKSCISKQIGWEQAQTIDLLMLHLGKNPPAKTNSGISHNIRKTTSKPIKTSINLKVPTSSTLPPNYSIRAKGSTSQSLYFKHCAAAQRSAKIRSFRNRSLVSETGHSFPKQNHSFQKQKPSFLKQKSSFLKRVIGE